MLWQVQTRGDQIRFTVAMALIVLAISTALRPLMLPPELVAPTLFPGSVMAIMIAAPIGWIVARRLRAVHDLSARLEHALHHDLLTGVRTRASFHEAVAALEGQPCAVIVADIDHFKGFNDCHGHFAGDQALRQFATILASNCRGTDLVARFGGEEFVIVLPGVDMKQGGRIADRLADRVRSSAIYVGERSLSLTASFGVAPVQAGGDMDQAIQQADRALYQAKHAGRDRVCRYHPGLDGPATLREVS
ncbi:putative diguanylate cyclase YedQ [Roseovarius sp. A-2]|uniref:GGDEF domain-containing protein n=1 Tax=Roseovarius sp. A-2 TaxID=1570360 RepID=UPI0009B59104|nr:GGDEF domain-containing protein [Roseovarius sp. A-2]GAW35927.1 putative diguanylate cyclase YedQ [Roseovarius sp. A-2]